MKFALSIALLLPLAIGFYDAKPADRGGPEDGGPEDPTQLGQIATSMDTLAEGVRDITGAEDRPGQRNVVSDNVDKLLTLTTRDKWNTRRCELKRKRFFWRRPNMRRRCKNSPKTYKWCWCPPFG